MSRPLTECNNCLQQFASHYPYCPYCGQKTGNHLSIGLLFNNTLHNYFSVDARFFKSFLPLLYKPGYLPKQFVNGRRLLYLHPAQMYLFISIVFFFLFSFISREQAEIIDSEIKKDIAQSNSYRDSVTNSEAYTIKEFSEQDSLRVKSQVQNQESILVDTKRKASYMPFNMIFSEVKIDSMITAGASDKALYREMGMLENDSFLTKRAYKQALKFIKNKSGGSILHAFYDSIPLAMFILLPIFAFILKLFYYRRGRFVHHLVFSFYFFAFLFAILTLLVIGNLIWTNFSGWITFMLITSVLVYLIMALKHFYEQGWGLSIIKANAISFVFLSFVLPFAILIMSFMAFLFY